MDVRRDEGEKTEFITLSFGDSREAIVGFAGEDIEAAVFYPEDDRFLIERENRVAHYDIVAEIPDEVVSDEALAGIGRPSSR